MPPALTPGHVKRPSVDALLDLAAKSRICLVIGAPGWGKTTAVASWSAGRPTAWVPYEDHEGDADLLLGRLVTVLQDYALAPRGTSRQPPGPAMWCPQRQPSAAGLREACEQMWCWSSTMCTGCTCIAALCRCCLICASMYRISCI